MGIIGKLLICFTLVGYPVQYSNSVQSGYNSNDSYVSDYITLLNEFPVNKQGEGYEPSFPGISEQPMTYGLLLSSESLHYMVSPNEDSKVRIKASTKWLLQNIDLDQDGFLGWGLPQAWDAFGDGSVNPENHPYTITTAIVMQGLLDALSIPSFWNAEEQSEIKKSLKTISIQWSNKAWSETPDGHGFFWYSPRVEDAHFCPNVSAMFLGMLSRVLKEHRDIFDAKEVSFIKTRVDSAAKSIVDKMISRNGLPYWNYIALPNVFNQNEPNDLVHHAYILWGMELYRDSGGPIKITWTTEQALKSLDSFWKDGKIFDYPMDQKYTGTMESYNVRPGILWGPGMMLAVYARYGDGVRIKNTHEEIIKTYGPLSQLHIWPASFSQDQVFYARYAAHILYGLAINTFKRK
ncbi:hypothetical protein [Brevibacillus sp. SYSU BS000544]|uniref:hypothetical protein n=1 Tax=Brevibacillus sp. SYSU BS000544 TaxID=3416443 RepID=UPI003CE4CF7D